VEPEQEEMMFRLKRPCANCPFRRTQGKLFGLGRERVEEIVEAIAFQCHKTVDYEVEDDEPPKPGDKPQQCAGLMAVLHREGRPNQIMQIAIRLGHLNPVELDPDNEAYASIAEALEDHT
jgi:hypothetical protein